MTTNTHAAPDPMAQIAALTEQVALLTSLVASVASNPTASAAPLDKGEVLHADTLYPHLKALSGEGKAIVTCVARRGVSTGTGEYLQPGETSQPIPKSIADALIESGKAIAGDKAPKDLRARHALEAAEEAEAAGGFQDADASLTRIK